MKNQQESVNKIISFKDANYPKAYASIRKGEYRLKRYLSLSPRELERVEHNLWKFVNQKVSRAEPIKHYNSLPFLGAGWEWSVFRKDDVTVVKVPAGIFPEVSNKSYLRNSKHAYNELLRSFPKQFIATTTFDTNSTINIQTQEYINGRQNFWIGNHTGSRALRNIADFLDAALYMLDRMEWLPDFNIRRLGDGFMLRNVIIEKDVPKIIDFTAYYDAYRLYPERQISQITRVRQIIKEFAMWIKVQ